VPCLLLRLLRGLSSPEFVRVGLRLLVGAI
jgi:hypothetical protein